MAKANRPKPAELFQTFLETHNLGFDVTQSQFAVFPDGILRATSDPVLHLFYKDELPKEDNARTVN